ncbi:hypothetical protein SAMN04488540_10954 [Ferrimonas sediminum]|uniref:HNH endonuclease n=1 Tax=Ferrimonas sediminum TaxID=718193 RepID=A0A1G8UE06_9GAMM|nr:hypothetical protein [Ferrimonas sediminum]SDJ51834.1 hypothetical protein SAMN04488540_10954 [Ferrimonas sediminum]
MRFISVPVEDSRDVYQSCVDSISDSNLKARLNAVIQYIDLVDVEYRSRAEVSSLYTIPPNNSGNDDVVLGSVTKNEFKNLYSTHMVSRSKPARAIYDSILMGAPKGRCPFCGFGHATTLDHYLPKAKYPEMSVLPVNLIPSCKDCNTGKSATIAVAAEDQCLHPYYNHQRFIEEQWLFAVIHQTTPVTVTFYVKAPTHWDSVSQERVKTHFKDFNLASRYSIEAASQLSFLKHNLSTFIEYTGAKEHLSKMAQSHASENINSWQTAMHQALAQCDWYCEGGFA